MSKNTQKEEKNKIFEIVRKMEDEYVRGNTTISKYVNHNLYEVISTIEAYLNSTHISGKYDALGREKPFPNIVVSASNIWQRATDIDRKNIRCRASKKADVVSAFILYAQLQDWMTKESFGHFLNEWGRVLARYGSAVVKFVETKDKLSIFVVPWNRLIVDPINFEANPKIEVLELTEAELRAKGYDEEQVEALCEAVKARETIDGRKKDNKSGYIKIYEIHGVFELSYLTGKESDDDKFVQQMYAISYLATKKKGEYQEFTLYAGREKEDPYMITHLIKEDGRTLAIGAVEHLFQSQWMVSHSTKLAYDQLELASKLIFQTSDDTFLSQNAITEIENGDILIHKINQPITSINNTSHDISQLQSFSQQWKSLGNEITGISESMLGVSPKSGTPWRQTESLLQESYSLFELMTENKGLDLELMLRNKIIPFIKKTKLKNADEISVMLEGHDINFIDSRYIKSKVIKETNKKIKDKLLNDEVVTQEEQANMMRNMAMGLKDSLQESGSQRFFKPSDLTNKQWADILDGIEDRVEIDVTGESKDNQGMLATLSTTLQTVMTPGFEQNEKAKLIVDKILQVSGYLSPLELAQAKSSPMPSMMGGQSSGDTQITS